MRRRMTLSAFSPLWYPYFILAHISTDYRYFVDMEIFLDSGRRQAPTRTPMIRNILKS